MEELRLLMEDSLVLVNKVLRMKAENTELQLEAGNNNNDSQPQLSLRLVHLRQERSVIVELLSLSKVSVKISNKFIILYVVFIVCRSLREKEDPALMSRYVCASVQTPWAPANSWRRRMCSRTSLRPLSSMCPRVTRMPATQCSHSVSDTWQQTSRNGKMASSSSISSLCQRSLLASVSERLSFRSSLVD